MCTSLAKFYRRYCERSQLEMSPLFVSIMAVLASSKLQVSHIYLDKESPYGAISTRRLGALAPNLLAFDHAFARLETLQLNLRDWRPVDERFELESSGSAVCCEFFFG
jgi:hypothetical protein